MVRNGRQKTSLEREVNAGDTRENTERDAERAKPRRHRYLRILLSCKDHAMVGETRRGGIGDAEEEDTRVTSNYGEEEDDDNDKLKLSLINRSGDQHP